MSPELPPYDQPSQGPKHYGSVSPPPLLKAEASKTRKELAWVRTRPRCLWSSRSLADKVALLTTYLSARTIETALSAATFPLMWPETFPEALAQGRGVKPFESFVDKPLAKNVKGENFGQSARYIVMRCQYCRCVS